ncbi:Nif3-like dinuclear metal center hexameric protein [Campylobacter suis]|uniref:GTP cyclohydrolase 1 type 2 n=1 Tax=Campylobacter suis TaxID=2790657 RepID=A0ABM8Q0Y3_9BACT|nr:Nif3-like dinuclear metal center hexameric protein [Campylobacter suis]CAD7286491.1 GTP cyclohydrolase 1 type 2 [Campylobacter suis]
MKIAEIYDFLDKLSPFDTQESWDNSGLLVGSFYDEVQRIYLSLDIDTNLVQNALPNSLIIAHHPLIFKGLKSLDFTRYPSNLINLMIKKNISLIAAHTNYDKAVLNEYFVSEVLGLKISQKDEFLAYAEVDMSFDELVKFAKVKMGLENLRCVRAKERVKRIAVCTGSGVDLIPFVKADAFLTGDLKYHQALEAKENLLNLIDIGHFESEAYFGASLKKYLQNFKIEVIISDFKNPFTHY